MSSSIRSLLLIVVLVSCTSVGGPLAATHRPSIRPTPAATSATDHHDELAEILNRGRVQAGAPGALAVIRHDGGEIQLSSGTADLSGAAITPTTRFRIGSITKTIVAALVLDAVSRGTFDLEDDVASLVPGTITAEPPTTVRQLLDHTSGIFDEGNEGDPRADIERIADPVLRAEARQLLDRYEAGEQVRLSDRILVALAETHERYFAPGSDIHYSNINYQLLGMILERTTGRSLAALLDERIGDRLALKHTTLAPADASTPDLHGYDATVRPPQLVDISDDLATFGNGGNGGVISTADELLTVMSAIVSGRLLPEAMVAQMKQPTFASYGLGLVTYELSCGTFFGHGGSVLGTQSQALISDDGADGVVVALNLDGGVDPGLPSLAGRLVCGR